MTNLLARLAARATNDQPQIRPQTISRFEADNPGAPLLVETEETFAEDMFATSRPAHPAPAQDSLNPTTTALAQNRPATPSARRANPQVNDGGTERLAQSPRASKSHGILPGPPVSARRASAPSVSRADTAGRQGERDNRPGPVFGPVDRSPSIAGANFDDEQIAVRAPFVGLDQAEQARSPTDTSGAPNEVEELAEHGGVTGPKPEPSDAEQHPLAAPSLAPAKAVFDVSTNLAPEPTLLAEAAPEIASPRRPPRPLLAHVEPDASSRGLAAMPERAPATKRREHSAVAEQPKPAIRITIGRVEVRAAAPAPAVVRTVRAEPALSLDRYLARFEANR